MSVLLQLRTMATRKGAQELVDIVANQADLSSDFQVSMYVYIIYGYYHNLVLPLLLLLLRNRVVNDEYIVFGITVEVTLCHNV